MLAVPGLRDLSRKTGVSIKRLQRYWEQAERQASKSGYTHSNPSFYRFVLGAVKRRVGLSEAISEAEVVITMSDDQTLSDQRESTLLSSFLDPSISVIKPKDLIAELLQKAGEVVYNEFMDLLIFKKTPEVHKTAIVEFLTGRADLISIMCLEQLNSAETKTQV